MKPTMEELQSRNDTQAVTITRLWNLVARLRKQLDHLRRLNAITETQASKPTHRERLLAEAEAIFRGQE